MNEKWTHGPWQWLAEDESMLNLVAGPNDDHVLTLTPCKNCQPRIKQSMKFWGECWLPDEPEARLIAAAPELYDLLREAYDLLAKVEESAIEHVMYDGRPVEAWSDKAKAVLAKARGES